MNANKSWTGLAVAALAMGSASADADPLPTVRADSAISGGLAANGPQDWAPASPVEGKLVLVPLAPPAAAGALTLGGLLIWHHARRRRIRAMPAVDSLPGDS